KDGFIEENDYSMQLHNTRDQKAVFRCLVCGYYSDPIAVDRGMINEPTICGKPECVSKNSMTIVHNRC
ncbi:hypothetical protein M569_15274, partial [Genlisea aurea]